MGKRSAFARKPRDTYATPPAAVAPLVPHLPRCVRFAEPCAGNGALIDALRAQAGAVCSLAIDVLPGRGDVVWADALTVSLERLARCDLVITNPPWRRDLLHPMIMRWSDVRPTWALFDADWMHTKQAEPLLERCAAIVSVGRVKWIANAKMTGKDNAAWYLFDAAWDGTAPNFLGSRRNKSI